MRITRSKLEVFAPRATEEAIKALTSVHGLALLEDAGITTPMRLCQALAQWATETAGFRKFSESGNYSEARLRQIFPRYFNVAQAKLYARKPQAILNRAYASRLGNGNEASGDGWRYRGGGMTHTTGKYNYGEINRVDNPDSIRKNMVEALDSACQFWADNDMNTLADTGDVKRVTKRLNGGYNGLNDRRTHFKRAWEIWGDMDEDIVGVTVPKPVRTSTTVWTTVAKATTLTATAAGATGQLEDIKTNVETVVGSGVVEGVMNSGFLPSANVVFVVICLAAAAAVAYVIWRKRQDYQL